MRDACQALLSGGSCRHFDFQFFSPRKFLGVPDGGILAATRPGGLSAKLRDPPLARPRLDWWMKSFGSILGRHDYDLGSKSRDWFALYQQSEETAPTGPIAMSQLAEGLLRTAFDYDKIAARRRANYGVLLERLRDLALFPELLAEVVPLGFPIRVGNRDALRRSLFHQGIFTARTLAGARASAGDVSDGPAVGGTDHDAALRPAAYDRPDMERIAEVARDEAQR